MKKLSALIAMTLISGVVYAQAPMKATTTQQGTTVEPATKGDVKAAAKVEKAEIKANEKIEKASADAIVTGTKADAKAAKTKAAAQSKADKKILAAKKDVADAQVDANAKVTRDHK
jgi:cytoskeletal protein RodZ